MPLHTGIPRLNEVGMQEVNATRVAIKPQISGHGSHLQRMGAHHTLTCAKWLADATTTLASGTAEHASDVTGPAYHNLGVHNPLCHNRSSTRRESRRNPRAGEVVSARAINGVNRIGVNCILSPTRVMSVEVWAAAEVDVVDATDVVFDVATTFGVKTPLAVLVDFGALKDSEDKDTAGIEEEDCTGLLEGTKSLEDVLASLLDKEDGEIEGVAEDDAAAEGTNRPPFDDDEEVL